MATRLVVAMSLALVAGAVCAQATLPTVEVRAETEETLSIACQDPAPPSLKDVERVLAISDPAQTAGLRKKLMGAAREACDAGEPRIQVMRGGNGKGLTWKAVSAP